MADPWAQFKDAPTDDPWAQFADAEAAPVAAPESTRDMLKREFSPANVASAAVRPLVKGLTAGPGIFADGAMAAWNLASGQNNQMPSEATSNLLDQFTVKPTGYGKGAEFVSSSLVSAGAPVPKFGAQAPAGFKPPQTVQQRTLAASRAEGLVVPPSTVNPTVGTRIVETLGGKTGTAQDASIANQSTFNRLARRALSMADEAPIDRAALQEIRQNAAPAYENIRKAGQITADAKYKAELGVVTQRFRGAAKDFPNIAKTDIDDIVKEVQKDTFAADSAVDAISILRDKASTAYAQGDKTLGKAYRSVSDAMENVIERNLAGRGEDAAKTLREFRDARQLIAKTYSVEKALNESTGNIAGQKLGQQLAKGKPLSGDLKTIAEFSRAFPRAAREVVDSGSVRNTDAVVAAVPAGLSGQPWYLAYPFLRMGARNALLSETVQNSLVRQARGVPQGLVTGAAPGFNELNALSR